MAKTQIKDQLLINSVVAGLRLLRTEQKITQEDFYNDTGIHISRIETGRVNISISTLKAILDYYKVTMSSFFDRINN